MELKTTEAAETVRNSPERSRRATAEVDKAWCQVRSSFPFRHLMHSLALSVLFFFPFGTSGEVVALEGLLQFKGGREELGLLERCALWPLGIMWIFFFWTIGWVDLAERAIGWGGISGTVEKICWGFEMVVVWVGFWHRGLVFRDGSTGWGMGFQQ